MLNTSVNGVSNILGNLLEVVGNAFDPFAWSLHTLFKEIIPQNNEYFKWFQAFMGFFILLNSHIYLGASHWCNDFILYTLYILSL